MGSNQQSKTKEIRVAILAEEPLGWGSGKHYFPVILDGYSWTKGDTTYRFSTNHIFDKEISQGKLNISNFDALIVPGGGVGDGESIVKGFNISPSVQKWKRNIADFIKAGGGYVGICGGTALITGLQTGKTSSTFMERQYNKSSIGATCVDSYYNHLAFPLLYPHQKKFPERIGATGYVFSFAPGETTDGTKFYAGGAPIDFQINNNHPIFSDFPQKTERIRWWGGPALLIPDKPDREVQVLARYPEKDFSKDKSTRIRAWNYTGGFLGLTCAKMKALKLVMKEKERLKLMPMYTYYLAGDWEPTDKYIELDYANKAAMTAEIYPNENKGRILLCTAHPEYMVWWGGHIKEVESNKFNCIATGLHQWKDVKPLSKTLEDELTHTWWIVRRSVAWAAKLPDDHLPPIGKGHLTEKGKELVSDIFCDGNLLTQMKNI